MYAKNQGSTKTTVIAVGQGPGALPRWNLWQGRGDMTWDRYHEDTVTLLYYSLSAMRHMRNFTLSSSHLKKEKKSSEINFNVSYLIQYIQNIVLAAHNQHKNINEIFYILFLGLRL